MANSRLKKWTAGLLSTAVFGFTTGAITPDFAFAANDNGNTIKQTQKAEPRETDRETRTLTLANGLNVHLTHDPKVQKSAAALSVGTGQIYDPVEKAGLAHYLEHMLFLGTEKYPEVGSYKKYLFANGGSSNAYTALDMTNYFFEVSHEGFNEALDRFSDFFKAPLFDKTYAAREVNAVNSEHDKNIRSDGWRGRHLRNQIVETGHPLSKFGTGNKDTLAGDNQEALIAFYKKYYSAQNMEMSMVSTLPLDKQEAKVREYFAGIPSFDVQHPEIKSDYRKPLQDQYRLLTMKTVKDYRKITMDFPTIHLTDHKDSKPANIVGSVIGHEGQGSLLSKLKEEGLATSLSAGGGASHPSVNIMSISAELTPKGMKNYERVMELTFSYIEMLKSEGIKRYSFEENKNMAQVGFDWKTPGEGMGYASGKTSTMHEYDLKDVDTLPYLFQKFDPAAYQAVLETMTPENMLVSLEGQNMPADKVEEIYGTEYALTEVGGNSFNKLKNPPVSAEEGMTYPKQNPFIPDNLTLQKEEPHKVIDDERGQIWLKFDNDFGKPQSSLSLNINTPHAYDNVDNLVRAILFTSAIQEGLNEEAYPIQQAGLGYSLNVTKEGISLSFSGYSQKISALIDLVSRNLMNVKIDEEKFNTLKDNFIRGWSNQKFAAAHKKLDYYHRMMLSEKRYSREEKINAMKTVTLEEVKNFPAKLFARTYIEGMAGGNMNSDDVENIMTTLGTTLKSKPLPKEEFFVNRMKTLHEGENILFSKQIPDNNNALQFSLRVGELSMKEQATIGIMSKILQSDFYLQMRTNQQLGYIVWSYPQPSGDDEKETWSFNFVIQGDRHGPVEMQKRVEDWLQDEKTIKIFDNLTDEAVEKLKAIKVKAYEQDPKSAGEELSQLFYLITEENADFDHWNKRIQAVKDVTKEDVIAMAKKILFDPDRTRLVMHMRANQNENPAPEGSISSVEAFKNRNNDKPAP